MHEIGVVRSMVKTVLDIGELSLVIPKYVEDIYPVVVGDTWLKDTKLVINVIPGMTECDECNELFHVIEHEGYCPNCGSFEKPYFRARIFSSARYTYPKTENIWAPCLPWSPSAYKKSETFLYASKTPHFL